MWQTEERMGKCCTTSNGRKKEALRMETGKQEIELAAKEGAHTQVNVT